jgi:hypothetical protein
VLALIGCGPTDVRPPTPQLVTAVASNHENPGATPIVFAPGLVSTDLYERDLAFTPDGREVYWTVFAPADRQGTIVMARRGDDGSWGHPEIPQTFVGHNSLEPFVTADGGWLWFASTRALPGETGTGDYNLWRAPRDGDGWGTPEALPEPIRGDGDEYYPSLTRDGVLYFTAERDGGLGGEDLYRSRPVDGGWSPLENLGPNVNSAGPEFNALVHPDRDWILFGSAREGDAGGGDLYISFADGDGWTAAVALPVPLNSPSLDFCPSLSPGGDWLYFSSRRSLDAPGVPATYDELVTPLRAPGNGQCDIFWVDATVLDALAQ